MARRDFPTKKTSIPAAPEVEKPERKEPITGTVVGCRLLNIRTEPDIDSDVVCVVPELSTLAVDLSESSNGWFHVYTPAGVEGYCMKKYVVFDQ